MGMKQRPSIGCRNIFLWNNMTVKLTWSNSYFRESQLYPTILKYNDKIFQKGHELMINTCEIAMFL